MANRGDEFLSWSEDDAGNLIAFKDEQYYYANWANDGIAISNQPAGMLQAGLRAEESARADNIPASVLTNAESRREKLAGGLISAPENAAHASSGGVTRNVLAIYMQWQNTDGFTDKSILPGGPKEMTEDDVRHMIFGRSDGTVNGYYMSLLDSQSDVIVPAAPKGAESFNGVVAIKEPFHPNTGPSNAKHEPLKFYKDTYPDYYAFLTNNYITDPELYDYLVYIMQKTVGQYDFSAYDANHDGRLDGTELVVCFVLQGYEASSRDGDKAAPSVHGMMYGYPDPGVGFSKYGQTINNLAVFGSNLADGSPSTIGVMCHELGHACFYFKDTYDTGGFSGPNEHGHGLGYWSLMDQGGWGRLPGGAAGSQPGYVDAYNLVASGLVTPKEIAAGKFAKVSSANQADICKIAPDGAGQGQYFLLQTRRNQGYDESTFRNIEGDADGGLLIYQVDETVDTRAGINDKISHYTVGVLEADGNGSLQNPDGDYGSAGDLWGINGKTGVDDAKGASISPNTYLYSGFTLDSTPPSKDVKSRVAISNIYFDPSKGSTFTVGSEAANPADKGEPEEAADQAGKGEPEEIANPGGGADPKDTDNGGDPGGLMEPDNGTGDESETTLGGGTDQGDAGEANASEPDESDISPAPRETAGSADGVAYLANWNLSNAENALDIVKSMSLGEGSRMQAAELASALRGVNMFYGINDDEDYDLDRPMTRLEALTVVLRLTGLEGEAKAYTGGCPFTDAPEGARNILAYAHDRGIAAGNGGQLFSPNRDATYTEYCAYLLRACGYSESDGDFVFEEASNIAASLPLAAWGGHGSASAKPVFFRNDAVAHMSCFLLSPARGSDRRNIERLVESGKISQQAAEAFASSILRGSF